ncbi:MAG TPA: cardiolipin synthase, partial [Xanthomonadaceae bacterium]|nr:cardiolipin synthase [Xanthomonadaceae bacterium]
WLVGAWLLYVVWVGGWIILQKREPAATISWLLGLALLPYLGFIVYYFFGPQRIHRQRLRRERSRASLPDSRDGPEAECRELAQLGRATTGLAPSTAADVRLLSTGEDKYEALLADIASAGRYIHLEYYIWTPDRIGTRVRDALVERARAGVAVRLLLDAVGAVKCDADFFQPLVDAGGELAWFHPVRLLKFWKRPWVNLRNHRKIVVIDGAVAYTGGMNITDEQDARVDPSAYRDLHLRLTGEVVSVLQSVFMDDWAYATRRVPSVPAPDTNAPGAVPAQVLTSGPDSPWEAIHRLHVGAIHAARKRVWLVTPYFVPGEAGMMALTSAALGGLDVRLVIPKMSDSRVVTYATRSYFDELLAAGVKLYEYGPRLMHSKALLVDDDLALIGSANFDHRSFRLNFEVQVLFRDTAIATALARLVEHDLAHAPRVKAERHRPLFRDRLPEALARLVSPLL